MSSVAMCQAAGPHYGTVFLHLQELEQERVAKRKLESMVCSLMQEVERLKEVM